MAIYQFPFRVVPRKGVFIVHGIIPSDIGVSIGDVDFDTVLEGYWTVADIPFETIKLEVDMIISTANWGGDSTWFNWKTETAIVDNDASMVINADNGYILAFEFRFDLREPNLHFFHAMLGIASKHDLLLVDLNSGHLFQPVWDEIEGDVMKSQAFRFVESIEKRI